MVILLAAVSCNQRDAANNQAITTNKVESGKRKVAAKYDQPAKFIEVFASMRAPAEGLAPYSAHYALDEWKLAQRTRKQRGAADPLPWQERGPGNVGGRTRAAYFDPADSTLQTWYAGAVGGGVWRTEDAGDSWTHLTEDLPHLAIGDLAISPANPDVIYAGTGEGMLSLPSIDGIGIWKSSDRGDSWSALQATLDDERFLSVTRMIVDPADENHVLASIVDNRSTGASYVMRSTDGGSTWNPILESPGARFFATIQQIFATEDFGTLFASINSIGLLRTDDLGATWDTVYHTTPRQQRIEGAVFASNPDILYLSIEDESGVGNQGSALMQTLDGGTSWRQIRNEVGPLTNWLGGQGWYDNTIAIHPTDSLRVFAGGQLFVMDFTVDTALQTFKNIEVEDSSSIADVADFGSLQIPLSGVNITENLLVQGGTSTGVKSEDIVPITLQFSRNDSFLVHRFTSFFVRDTVPLFLDATFIGVQAVNTATGEKLAVGFSDENDNGRWDISPFTDGSFDDLFSQEPLYVYTLPYDSIPNPSIVTDVFHQNMYTIFLTAEADESVDSLDPEGFINLKLQELSVGIAMEEFLIDGSKGVHVDHHNIQLAMKDSVLHILNGNDGGLSYSSDGGVNFRQTGDLFAGRNSAQVSFGYNTSQFYGVDKMNGADRYVGGTQDNGSWVSPSDPNQTSSWISAPSGDGFEAIWKYDDPDFILESFQNNGIFRSTDQGENWSFVVLPEGSGEGPFVTQLAGSQTDPNFVFAYAENGVLRSTDFGATWALIDMPAEWVFDGGYAPIEISLADPNTVWTGSRLGDNNRLVVSTNGGTVFQAVSRYDLPTSAITGIATHPTQPETAYILFGGPGSTKILKTTDLGQTWADLSGFEDGNIRGSDNGFPDVITYSLLVMPFDTSRIWAGTEIGLFESLDGGASWVMADNGLPNTAIWDMKVVNDEVVVATHGRGIWSVPFEELTDYSPAAAVLGPQIEALAYDIKSSSVLVDYTLRSAYDSTAFVFHFNGEILNQVGIMSNAEPLNDTIFLNAIDEIPDDTIAPLELEIKSFVGGRELVGSRLPILTYRLDQDLVEVPFVDSINQVEMGNFARLGFTINQEPGFTSAALQSRHPHPEQSELLAIFQKPVVVSNRTAMVSYDQILILEPGDSPDINSEDFYDFGALEGSTDFGTTWSILSGGDATLDERWLDIFNEDGVPDSSDLYVNNSVNLKQFYDDGDTILLRFRLFSDPFVVGWGMAVDNFMIGDSSTSSRDENPLLTQVSTYPNPVRDLLTIEIGNEIRGPVDISILDLSGRVLLQQDNVRKRRVLLDTGLFPSGLIFVRVTSENGQVAKPIIKQ